jgi:hypothetical protein
MSEEVTPVSETEQAEILAEKTPFHVEAWRAEDTPRSLYKNTTGFESVIPDDYFGGADMPSDKREAAVKNLRLAFQDTGMSALEAQAMLNRAGAVRTEGKTVEQARKEARAELTRQFGKDGADAALADAHRLVTRDSRFARWIEKKGLGNDSATVTQLAYAARSQRIQGRLK